MALRSLPWFVSLVAVPSLALAASAQATFPGASGLVAVETDESGDYEVVVMGLDGSDPTNLTNAPASDENEPSWDPAGRRIVFTSDRSGSSDLFLMNADGSDLEQLTSGPGDDRYPEFCDEDTVIFASDRDGNSEIYAISTDGSGLLRLTNHPALDTEPTCRPDGERIAFVSTRSGSGDIYEINRDGTDPKNLTNHPSQDWSPDYSPDATALAFTSSRSGTFEVYLLGLPDPELARTVAGNRSGPEPGKTERVTTTPGGSSFDPVFLPGVPAWVSGFLNPVGLAYSNIVALAATRTIKLWFGPLGGIDPLVLALGLGSGPSVQPTLQYSVIPNDEGASVLTVFGTWGADDIRVVLYGDGIEVWHGGFLDRFFPAQELAGVGGIVLSGGPGDDTLRVTAGDEDGFDVWLDIPIGYFGGPGDDDVGGSHLAESLFGEAGDDTLSGGGGNDELRGGDGDDVIRGGGGRDRSFGGAGNDLIKGGGGNDRLLGGGQDDRLLGGTGKDFLDGGRGSDVLDGGPGTDRCKRGEAIRRCP